MLKPKTDIYALQRDLYARNDEIIFLKQKLAEKEAAINAITTSTAWKISYPYRLMGNFIKSFIVLLNLAIHNPKTFVKEGVRYLARFIRSKPALRKSVHRILAVLPSALTHNLIAVAPPSPHEAGHMIITTAHRNPDLLGECEWIYRRLVFRPVHITDQQASE